MYIMSVDHIASGGSPALPTMARVAGSANVVEGHRSPLVRPTANCLDLPRWRRESQACSFVP